MARHKLMPYELRVREKQNTVDYTDLLSLLTTNAFEVAYEGESDAPQTFVELYERYCREWKERGGAHVDQDKQKTFRISQDDSELHVNYDHNLIEGIIRYGNYGQTYKIYDTESGEEQTDDIDIEEAPDTPFYFLLHVPDVEPRTAILVLEQSGNIGVVGRVQDALRDKLPSGIIHEMTQVTDDALYDTIRSASRVKQLTIEHTESPHEVGDKFSDVFEPSSTSKTSTYKASDEGDIRMNVSELEDWFENEDRPLEGVNGQDYTEFRITVESAGSQNTIDLREGNVKISRILEGVEREGGHPLPNYMARESRQFVNQDLLPDGADPIPQDSPLRS